MNEKEATNEYEKLTYDLAKSVSKMADIFQRVKFINDQMGWDGMFECDFGEAMEKLANVQSAMIIYTMEQKYRQSDISDMESSLKWMKKAEANNEK